MFLGQLPALTPYPTIVRDFQRIIGDEARREILERENKQVVACVGGGSNAMGLFTAFVGDPDVELIGIEPGGHGILSGEHGATPAGTVGCLHGSISYVLQNQDGQINEHSIPAGLDYLGVGPTRLAERQDAQPIYRSMMTAHSRRLLGLVVWKESSLHLKPHMRSPLFLIWRKECLKKILFSSICLDVEIKI